MDERILVPLDGSRVGEAALPYVEDLVSKLKPGVSAEVVLFQAIPPMVHHIMGGEGIADIPFSGEEIKKGMQEVNAYLSKVSAALKERGVAAVTLVAEGEPAEAIVKAAGEVRANLIAMSTHGRSGLSRWAFGSVTDKVLRHEGSVPVTIVRAGRPGWKA